MDYDEFAGTYLENAYMPGERWEDNASEHLHRADMQSLRRAKRPKKAKRVITKCNICNSELVTKVDSKKIYNNPKWHGRIMWKCLDCGAYVSCIPGTDEPAGTLADADLRLLRIKVHNLIDPLWESGRFTRNRVYQSLAEHLNIARRDCHVGKFSKAMCMKVIEMCNGGKNA